MGEGRGRDSTRRDPATPATARLPRPRLGGLSKSGSGLESGWQGTCGKGSRRPPSAGAMPGEQLPSRAPLSPSRSALGSGPRHKGREVTTAQAREAPRLLGVVVRPPNGRSPARAGGRPGRISAHAPPFPPCSARPPLRPPGGRGFLVVRSQEESPALAPPPLHPDWATEGRAESGLALGVARLFWAVLMSCCTVGLGE